MNEEQLKKIIISTIKNEKHLGDNLKKMCVDYIEKQDKRINECIDYLDNCIKLEKRHGNLKWKNKIRFIKEGLTTECKTIQICRKIKAKLKENE